MSGNEKDKRLNIVLSDLEENFVTDYEFWRKLVDDINNSLTKINPQATGFTYNEFCKYFKDEMESYTGALDPRQNINLDTIHQAVKQIILIKFK